MCIRPVREDGTRCSNRGAYVHPISQSPPKAVHPVETQLSLPRLTQEVLDGSIFYIRRVARLNLHF